VDSITEDVRWLISGWADDRLGLKPKGKTPEAITSNGQPDSYLAPVLQSPIGNRQSAMLEPFYASDYFDQIYAYAVALIRKGKAFVCDLTPDETDEYRRNAKESPFRNRSAEENLDLFTRMKNGEFPTASAHCGRRLTSPRPTSGCAIPCSTASATPSIITPAASGASTRCTTSPLLERLPRRHHPQHLHAGIRGASPLYDWILESLELPRPLPTNTSSPASASATP